MTRFEEFDEATYYKAHSKLRPGVATGVNEIPRTDSHMVANANLPAPSKYHAQRTDGYPSKKHALFAAELQLRQKAGEVWFWLEEIPFKLQGGMKHRVDFLVFYKPNSTAERNGQWKAWELVEIKGKDLPMGKLKRRQVESLYGVKITVI